MQLRLISRTVYIGVVLVGASLASVLPAFSVEGQPQLPAKRLLYVGNSFFYYNNSLHNHVGRLLSAALPEGERKHYSAYSITISGGHLRWHDVAAYLNSGIGSSSFSESNELVSAAASYEFDTVMMMDCSRCPYDEMTRPVFHEYARKHSQSVRMKGAEPVFFMTWAYADKPEMTEILLREYVKAGRDNQALVVPAGIAFQRALAGRPDLRLHVSDRRHPSPEGTYLAACTVLASVYRINPIGNRFHGGLPPELAKYLQQVAWQTAQEFAGRQ